MVELIVPSRRRFLGLSLGLVCAPAIVRAARLMSVRAVSVEPTWEVIGVQNSLLTIQEIIREAVRLFAHSNQVIKDMTGQYQASPWSAGGTSPVRLLYASGTGLKLGDKITISN